MTTIQMNVELEPLDDERLVWWASAPAIPGLRVAADSLRELEFLARDAVRDVQDDEGRDEPVELQLRLVDRTTRTAAELADATRSDDSQVKRNVGVEGQRATAEPVLA